MKESTKFLYENSLQNIVSVNNDAIKNNSYDWNDEEVIMVYKLANDFARSKSFKNVEDKRDFVQESVTKFFNKYVISFDPCKSNISSYFYACMKNDYSTIPRIKGYKTSKNTISLDKMILNEKGEMIDIVDYICDNNMLASEKYTYDNWNKYVLEQVKQNQYLYEFFYLKVPIEEMMKKYDLTRNGIYKKMKRYKEHIIDYALDNGIDIPKKFRNSKFVENRIVSRKNKYTKLANKDNNTPTK